MQTLNLEQFKAATTAGGIVGITLRGDGGAFVVSVQTQRGEAIMVTSRQQPRRFTDPRKALQVLRTMGWQECRIDAAQWRPEERELEKTPRPDRRAALKAAHEASHELAQAQADYESWFRAKGEAALAGLTDGSNQVLSDEEVALRRVALRDRLQTMRLANAA